MVVEAVNQILWNFRDSANAALERANAERADLGLPDPGDHACGISIYDRANTMATASRSANGLGLIKLNVLPFILNELEGEDSVRLKKVLGRWDYARSLMNFPLDDDWVLESIFDPGSALERLETGLDSGKPFLDAMMACEENGISYDQKREEIFLMAGETQRLITKLIPPMLRASNGLLLDSTLRHELDHISYFGSKLHERALSSTVESLELARRLHVGGELEVSQEYAASKRKTLGLWGGSSAVSETRAHFFNHTRYGELGRKAVEEEVWESIRGNYLNGSWGGEILDGLLPRYWASGEMDRQTSNYLFFQVAVGCSDSALYHNHSFDETQVNREVVERVLDEFNNERKILAGKVGRATWAFSRAFAEDPTRFVRAQNAETFDEYLSACA